MDKSIYLAAIIVIGSSFGCTPEAADGVSDLSKTQEAIPATKEELLAIGVPEFAAGDTHDNHQFAHPPVHARYSELLENSGVGFEEYLGSIYTRKTDRDRVWAVEDLLTAEIMEGRFGEGPTTTSFPYDQGFVFSSQEAAAEFLEHLEATGVPHSSNPSREEYAVFWAPRDEAERENLKSMLESESDE